jgi:putative transposase
MFTEAEIVFALRPADTGITVAEMCRKMGISEATYYNWRKKYGGGTAAIEKVGRGESAP